MHNLDQKRAAYAWDVVQKCSKDYENLAKSAPALIMNNGLMQTLAFFQAKGKNHHMELNRHICQWLGRKLRDLGAFPRDESQVGFESVMTALHQAEPMVYRQATEEVLALLRWIRQFAPAVRTA